MSSKGRLPPPHLRHPLPAPGAPHHPAPYPNHPNFPPFEMLPPPEVMEHKLSSTHIEMDKLATENRRLASTHATLRQDLATAKHELQSVHAHIDHLRLENTHQERILIDKMAKMEAEIEGKEAIKTELQKARAEAKGLDGSRQELIAKVQRLGRELQAAHSEARQIPAMVAELEGLRREYQHCRATYEYEKKLYSDHLDSLHVMEKNYMAMSREVEKLRAELTNSAKSDPRTGGPYSGYNENGPMGNYASGQNTYGVAQGQSPIPGGISMGGAAAVSGGTPVGAAAPGVGGNSPHIAAQSAPTGSGAPQDPSKGHASRGGPGYDPQRATAGTGYDAGQFGASYAARPTGAGYNAQMGHVGPGYDPQMGHVVPGYDPQMSHVGPGYETQMAHVGPGYEVQMAHYGSGYEAQMGYVGPGYDAQQMGHFGPGYDSHRVQTGQGYDASMSNNAPYGSTGPTVRPAVPQGGNPVRR